VRYGVVRKRWYELITIEIAVKTGRVMLGETNPLSSKPGTIRGDFAVDVGRNVIHGSDAVDSANREIALWF